MKYKYTGEFSIQVKSPNPNEGVLVNVEKGDVVELDHLYSGLKNDFELVLDGGLHVTPSKVVKEVAVEEAPAKVGLVAKLAAKVKKTK